MHNNRNFADFVRTPHFYAFIILGCAMVLTYFSSLGHNFVFWDDQFYVVYNQTIKGFSIEHLQQAFTKTFVSNYAPIQIFSYMLDYEIWGMNPKGFILTNLLFHFMNGLLLYYLYQKLLPTKYLALLAALIFIVHPVQIESVVWISQRKNVLSMFFFLLSFVFYIESTSANNKTDYRYWISILFYSLALLTKVAAIVLPLILCLYDLCYRNDILLRDRLKAYTPYLLLSLILASIAVATQQHTPEGTRALQYAGDGYKSALTMLVTFPQYLLNICYPMFLSIIYSPPVKEAIDKEVIICTVLALLFFLEGLILFKTRKEYFFWYAFFFVSFIPVLQIIPLPVIMQDRYCYYPLIGFCGFWCLIVGNLLQQSCRKVSTYLIIVVMLLPVPILIHLARQKAAIWQGPLTLFRETAKLGIGSRYGENMNYVNFQHAEICYMMAETYSGKVSDSIILRYYLEALSYDPLQYKSLQKIGFLLLERGNFPAAQKYFVRLTENYDKSFEGFYGLGLTYQRSGNRAKAAAAYQRAVSLNPAYAPK